MLLYRFLIGNVNHAIKIIPANVLYEFGERLYGISMDDVCCHRGDHRGIIEIGFRNLHLIVHAH